MSRPDPIEYAERLYDAIRAANFSTVSFLSFGNAVKDGVSLRNLPRVAAEPFMRVVGEMLDLEEEVAGEEEIIDAEAIEQRRGLDVSPTPEAAISVLPAVEQTNTTPEGTAGEMPSASAPPGNQKQSDRRRNGGKR